ncbi:MAG: biopolymer transporter ExbD [Thiotrichales bacterium]|nr:biopolymer transporter ExbD [Thiotrichales bacterium]MBT3613892.1 biopolymer transporter ExbD [Thiotrichales bacterium]MBT3752968.1 biopolymer transporter ExbD [Thiotrichales bacterium]MBT3838186.1 biopolymer transporter ExbD [Thiotrichales bacterium]MBT4151824.1 biopolymer transporter ExbD [Thiotrichales bacterium]
MTPLVSVIFLLIIFFLVAGTIKAPDFWDLEHPQSSSTDPAEVLDIEIYLDQEGKIAVSGREVENRYQLHYLIERLTRNSSAESVEIHADHRVDSHKIIEILEELRESGVKKVELVTEVER